MQAEGKSWWEQFKGEWTPRLRTAWQGRSSTFSTQREFANPSSASVAAYCSEVTRSKNTAFRDSCSNPCFATSCLYDFKFTNPLDLILLLYKVEIIIKSTLQPVGSIKWDHAPKSHNTVPNIHELHNECQLLLTWYYLRLTQEHCIRLLLHPPLCCPGKICIKWA